MNNKLKEILDEYDRQDFRCDISPAWDREIKEFLKTKLIEYAKHVTRIGSSDPLWTEFQVCRIAFERRIDQDIQSLNN